MAPLVFAILAGRTPEFIATELIDERIEPVQFKPTDLVAMTVETFTANRAYQIADKYRQKGVPVIMGGHHPTLLPDEAIEHCDAVIIGDGEDIWEQVLVDAKKGCLKKTYRSNIKTGIHSNASLNHDIYKGKKYAPLSLIQSGRGCRFVCDFCSIHAFYGDQVWQRPVYEVIAEITAFPPDQVVFFVDDNLFSNKTYLVELLKALVPLKLQWCCQISIDVARDEKLLDLMMEAGCMLVLVGFESLNRENLKQMKKKWNGATQDYANIIGQFYQRGIMVYGTFVFGYDNDGPEAFDATVDFAIKANLCIANFNPLTPTPGTALYDRLKSENQLIYNRWWLSPQYRYGKAIFTPKGMSATELEQGCMRARNRFYSVSSILKRAIHQPALLTKPSNFKTMLVGNWISRMEISNKHNATLGQTP